ncbi:hypothetical protein ACFMPD_07615 [Sedimentitalea sp. HM32M-2]|uniref:hypothetical protein n=1 Tax=Sedimentitalea sp. HM32M-2 TaxID=3351566 RepID=UPI003638B9D4
MGNHTAAIQAAAEAIKSSGRLGRSDRRARLLDYLIAAECNGDGDGIKAFTIAVDVFGRDESFDPNSDSIVRSEIGRLRDALRMFYAENTRSDLVVIDIPKGAYRPVFTLPEPAPETTSRLGRVGGVGGALVAVALALALGLGLAVWVLPQPAPVVPPDTRPAQHGDQNDAPPFGLLRIAVMPFDKSGNHPELDQIAFGLYSELTLDLSAYPWVAVVSPLDPDDFGADYVLKSGLLWQDDLLQTNSQLISLPDQQLIWSKSDTASTTVEEIQAVQGRIASGIARSLGSDSGIAPDLIVARKARSSKTSLDAFLCFLGIYDYLATPTDDEHRALRTCLEGVVRDFPDYGEAWAALGVLYMDEARFGRNPTPDRDPWAAAGTAIETGLQLAPLHNPTLMAALILAIEAPQRDLQAAERHARKLLDLFPRHPETLALIGSRRAEFFGEWEAGLAEIEQALALEHSPPSAFYLTHAFHAAMGPDDTAAAQAAERLTGETSKPQLLLRYLAAARTGQTDEVQRQRVLLAEQGLTDKGSLVQFVRQRRYDDALERALLDQLQAASDLDPRP